jgi:hypothetical protein
MDERAAFWKCYKYSAFALGSTLSIALASAAAVGDLDSVLEGG